MKPSKILFALSIFALTAVACSDDSSDDTNSDAAAYVTSCKALCQKQTDASCSAYGTVDECNTDCEVSAEATGDCATKLKAYGECTDAAADACTAEDTCSDAMSAMITACS